MTFDIEIENIGSPVLTVSVIGLEPMTTICRNNDEDIIKSLELFKSLMNAYIKSEQQIHDQWVSWPEFRGNSKGVKPNFKEYGDN